LTKFDIINRVTIKKNDWVDKLLTAKKPVFIVINRAYLTSGTNYQKITKKNLSLILHDECHNTSSEKCNNFLKHCKSQDIPIVGFSATPVRSSKKDKEKLLEIYSSKDNNKQLNLLTNYSMMYAIKQKLILPPEFHWYNIDSYNKLKKEDVNNNDISERDIKSVLSLFNDLVVKLPNKKIVGWCGTITMTNKWKAAFEKNCKDYNNLKNLKFGIDTSKHNNNDYDTFKKAKGNMILFCACKHREGSDINFLDCCIFLDKVKNRGNIPFIQSIGRVLRICLETPTKTKGVIIDCVADNENYDKEFVDKILGYYIALENLASITDEADNKYKVYVKLMSKITFDKENNQVKINMGNDVIEINCSKLEWDNIIVKFNKVLRVKCELDEEEKLKADYITDVSKNKELNIKTKVQYQRLVNDCGLTENPEKKYATLWKGWYEYLGIDTSIYPENYDEWKQKCKDYGIHSEEDYFELCDEYNLPMMIKELYPEYTSFMPVREYHKRR